LIKNNEEKNKEDKIFTHIKPLLGRFLPEVEEEGVQTLLIV
tara:strand:+ start:341 stop:463 length:123 start_codon:yes stop_codon:yes gene_type:complete